MNAHPHCTDDELRFILQMDDLETDRARSSQADSSRADSSHVESCPDCQTRLAEMAADEQSWAEAREIFSSRDEDVEEQDRSERSRRWRAQPSAWTESFARQMLAPASHPELLGRIGRYDVERIIGSGGMGVVFKAFDSELNRPVAVKVLAPFLAGSGAARKRFAREARAAAAVVHEHVVAIHNVESDGESPFLVMKFVAGESLQQRLDREGPLELCEILRIGMQTASGLAAAHSQGLVHRDVKPSNILLEQGVERALLTDFGLARAGDDASLTHSGYHPGTPQYMSPEQARGDAVDARSDLFSLGSVMYALCTGRLPFRAETSYGILRRITDVDPRPIREINPGIPDWLERMIGKLLAKRLEERYQTADEVATLLAQCLAHVQHPTASPLPACLRGASPRTRRKRILVGAAVVAVAGALLMAVPALVTTFSNQGSTPSNGLGSLDRANQLTHEVSESTAKSGASALQVRQAERASSSSSQTLDANEASSPTMKDWTGISDEKLDRLNRDLSEFERRANVDW